MTEESPITFTITLTNPDLDEEEKDETARYILQEMKEIDAVERVSLAKTEPAPTGSKAITRFGIGMVEAVVQIANIQGFMDFLGDRFREQPIEMEVEANGRKLQIKASNQEDLLAAIKAAADFVNPD